MRSRGLAIVAVLFLVSVLSGEAHAHTTQAPTRVRITNIDTSGGVIDGTVGSRIGRCVDGRTVRLLVNGAAVGTTQADEGGIWSIDHSFNPGDRVIARAVPFNYVKNKQHRHGCAAANSPAIKLPHRLSVTVTGGGGVISDPPGIDCTASGGSCSGLFEVASLTAMPADDFIQWGDACSGTLPSCQVSTKTASKHVTAAFDSVVAPPRHTLTVDVTGRGTVTGTGINCTDTTGDCSETYDEGTSVTLTATPDGPIVDFEGWSDDCAGTASTCQLTMNSGKVASAAFSCALPEPLCGIVLTVINALS